MSISSAEKLQSVAFTVDIVEAPGPAPPSLLKRLQQSNSRQANLEERLLRAEEKRRTRFKQPSTTDARLMAAQERRGQQFQELRDRVSREEAQAAENRRLRQEKERARLRDHLTRVEVVCQKQQETRRICSERKQQSLDLKLEVAQKRREDNIKQKRAIAQQSADRKLYFEQDGADGKQVKVSIKPKNE